MKSSELRIGNKVLIGGSLKEEAIVLSISNKLIGYETESRKGECNIDWIKPILLTNEWLLRFRFKQTKEDSNVNWFTKNGLDIVIGEVNFIVFDHLVLKHFKYVHQFQNLYFSVIGKELNLKI